MSEAATSQPSGGTRFLHPDRVKEGSLVGIILVSLVVFAFLIEGYLSGRFFNRVTTSVVVVALLAAAQALVIFSRNIDLSVGSIVGVAAYLTGDFLGATGLGPPLGMLVAVVVGAVLGSVNGVLVAYGGVPAIIVTLGTLALFRTLLSIYSGGANILAGDLPGWVLEFNNVTLFTVAGFEIRLVFVIALVVILSLQWAFARLRWGRRIYAIGSNPSAAAQAGLPASKLVFWSFVGSGALAGLAGFMFMIRAGTISATAGAGLELESVAAAVVGGVSILGGSGTMLGALLGAVLIDTLKLSLVRVPEVSEFWRDAFLGVLVLAAVIIDTTLRNRFNKRWSAQARAAMESTGPTAVGMPRMAGGGGAADA